MGAAAACVVAAGCAVAPVSSLVPYRVEGDAIPGRLTSSPADSARGREILMGRDGNCLLCHAIPETGARFMGNLGPSLSGVGARLDAGQLRLRLVDSMRLNPQTVMPSYYRTEGYNQVAAPWRDKPVLDEQQIEDVVQYLLTLR